MVQNILKICMRPHSSYFFIILREPDLKNIFFSVCEILGLFRNTFIVNDKYPVRDCDNFPSLNQMQLSSKTKNFFWFLLLFLESSSNLKNCETKSWSSYLLYYGIYRLWKTWLDHSLKNNVSEHPLTVNMLNSTKHLYNLHESTFIIFFHHSERTWLEKYLP